MEFTWLEYWSGFHFLLHWIFVTQRLNPCLLQCREILYHLAAREALFHCIYIYIYIYIHTHTHTYMHTPHLLYPFICQWTFRTPETLIMSPPLPKEVTLNVFFSFKNMKIYSPLYKKWCI